MEESDGQREIHFIVDNPISVDTHCVVIAMTYQEYSNQYADLRAMYPDLKPFTLYNEYDQAECKRAIRKNYRSCIQPVNKLFTGSSLQ